LRDNTEFQTLIREIAQASPKSESDKPEP
jgi:hypothetical protein